MGYEEFAFPVHANNTMIGVLFIGGLSQESSSFQIIIHDIENIIFLIENAYHEYQFLLTRKKVPPISEGTLKNEHIVMSTMRFIKEHYSRDLSLNLLASHVYINPSYLSTLFKKVLNIPLSHYINQIRITESLYYLSSTQMTVTEIAKEVGYIDPAYFSKVFKSIEGLSPLAYRNSTSRTSQP